MYSIEKLGVCVCVCVCDINVHICIMYIQVMCILAMIFTQTNAVVMSSVNYISYILLESVYVIDAIRNDVCVCKFSDIYPVRIEIVLCVYEISFDLTKPSINCHY